LRSWTPADGELLGDLFELMHRAEIDMTDFFRQLAQIDIGQPDPETLREAFYSEDLRQQFAPDLARWLRATALACATTGSRRRAAWPP
jgi:uncharacterized protein YdiU (UPF0061 family)